MSYPEIKEFYWKQNVELVSSILEYEFPIEVDNITYVNDGRPSLFCTLIDNDFQFVLYLPFGYEEGEDNYLMKINQDIYAFNTLWEVIEKNQKLKIMANYCDNYVVFSGKKENLERMMANIKKAQELNPEGHGLLYYSTYWDVLEQQKPEEDLDVYDEFGSRYLMVQDMDLQDHGDDSVLTISGYSAWSPTSYLFLRMSEVYDLSFESEFSESGCDFGGFFSGNRGQITYEKDYTYKQYDWLQRDFECIELELDCELFETKEDYVEYFSSIQEVCTPKEWKQILEIIDQHFENIKTK